MDSFDRTDIQKCIKHLQELIRRNSLSLSSEIVQEDKVSNSVSTLLSSGMLLSTCPALRRAIDALFRCRWGAVCIESL